MRQSGRLGFCMLFALCLVLAQGASAVAATAVTTDTASVTSSATAPLAQGTTSLQVGHDAESNTDNVLVDVVLDPAVKLPARVRIPLAPGATVLWAGEILGGDPNADPERQYTLHAGNGGQYAEFTLMQSHTGQLDTGGLPVTQSGSMVTSKVDFVQSTPSTITGFSVRVPAGVSQVSISPRPEGSPESNSAGEHLYTLTSQALLPGQKVTITISYNAAPQPAPSRASNQIPIIVTLCFVLVAVIAALAFVLRRAARVAGDVEDDSADVLDDSEDTADAYADEGHDAQGRDVGEELPEDSDPFSDDEPFGSAE